MFRGCGSLSEIVGVEDFDTTSAIYLNGMFWNNKITSLDLTGWNTSNVTTIEHLFRGCSKLETLNVSNWNVANVTNMSDVFGTPVLNELDLSKWTNSKVTKTGYMFQGGNYTVLDLSGIDTSLVTDMGYMFNETGKIQTVYVLDKFVINTNQAMFINNKAMVGGAGTNYPGGAFMTSYGVVDNPDNDEPGFFTYKNTRYIRYHDNDGDDTNDEANYALMPSHYMTTDSNNPYDLATKLAKNNYTREGYKFLGWAESAEGEVVYADEAEIANLEASKLPLELYAKWEIITSTLTFDKNTDDTVRGVMAEQSIIYDAPTALTANAFDRGYYAGNTFYSGRRYEFRGWNRAADGTGSHYDNEAVVEREFTEDTTLYAEWFDLCRTFETDSWSTIISNLADDPMYYTPYGGCTKMVAIDMDGNGEDENYTVRLANTTTPEECTRSGYSQTGCGTVIEFVEDVAWRVVNSQNTNSGSWASTQLASWLNSDFYNKLPADLRSVIIPTYPIVTGTGSDGTSSDITKYDVDKNKIYLYSPKEIGIDNANDNRRDAATDTRILDYYTKHYNAVALSRNSEVINKNSNQWFTRTPVASTNNFYHAIVSGSTYSSNANVGRGIAPVFRIGTPPSCRDFATDSWSTIVSNLESDPDYYSSLLGCQKEVEMDIVGSDGKWGSDGVNESYTVMLTNTSTPEECATAGFSQTACGTVIEFMDKVTERRWTNKSGTNAVAGGWKASELAGWLNGDFYEKLPDDLKQVIVPSYIVSSNAGGLESPDITLGDTNLNKIYLYSTKELGQPRTSASNIEDNKIDSTRVADFYNIADNRTNYLNRGSQLSNQWHCWWLRSSVLQRNNLPHDVQAAVTAGPGAENALGIFPVFRIGRKFTVTFDAGDGTPSEASREYVTTATTYGTLPTITTSPEGKIFAGWYTEAEGGEKVEDNSTFISNNTHTLYAHWSAPIQASPSLLYNDGKTINAKLKKLAGDNSADQNSHNFNIKAIKTATALPNGFTPTEANVISSASLDSNNHRIFAWFDAEANGGTIQRNSRTIKGQQLLARVHFLSSRQPGRLGSLG